MREAVQDLSPAYQRAATGAANAGATMVRTHRQIGDGVESISQQLDRLQKFYVSLQGIQGLKTMALDLAATADQVNNLQGRMKLVTGEGDNFIRSWEGVTQVALRTHSALEETGVLFTRLAQAGKEAGLNTAQAAEQSLALSETINQSIQLSGASAQASAAAITQLVQGLQGGALRGDEFNSVMEQAPRLARALADGLGVTTGELRKMAEAGVLTSDTVIKALQGQSDVVATEFTKLPLTVGRALQDLSTQWTLYVAGTDKATGASATAATAINAVSNNLRTIAGLLIDAGQAAAAFVALRLAQHFLGIGAAAQGAAVAVAASNAQMAVAGTTSAAAAVGVGRFAAILATLRTFTLIGLVANFKDIGTWIGESTAKLMGYKDRSEELARAEQLHAQISKDAAADRARLAAAIQAAIDKQFELSKAARSSVAEFDALTKSGTLSGEAIKKITEGFDLTKIQGIKDFSATLDKLVADGKIAAGEFEVAWAQALSGKDLAQFEVVARAAFSGAMREGERLAQVTDALLRESVKRTGLEFEVMQGRIGVASRSAINDLEVIIGGLDRLKEQGVDVGRVLNASISKAINTADSQAALDAVRAQIERVRAALGEQVANGLLDQAAAKAEELKNKLDQATGGVNSVREAMAKLGLQSSESLQRAANDAVRSFEVIKQAGRQEGESYLTWQRRKEEAARAMVQRLIDANRGVADSAISARAAAEGLRVETDSTGRSIVKSMDDARASTEALGRSAGSAAGGFQVLGQSAAQAGEQIQRLRSIHDRQRLGGSDPEKSDIQNLYDRYSMNGDQSLKDIDASRKNVSGNASINDTDIQADIVKRYGEEMLDDPLTRQAFTLRLQLNAYRQGYGTARSKQSLQEQANIMAALERVEREIEERRLAKERERKEAEKSESGSASSSGSSNDGASDSDSRSSGSGISSGTGTSTGNDSRSESGGTTTYVSNITLPGGRTVRIAHADAESQSTTEQLLRDLAAGKGVFQ
ncbi:tape measure protein [Acidovorax sp.]|uniref:tape measure protein n=1 Tax=Acidovorax sp. TaxID=1872122 RepID=UPI0027B9C852|nr:tape measure protein [Acidovorax sp.]